MKLLTRYLKVFSISASLALTATADNTVVLPENVFPQLKQIMENAVTQSPRMIISNLDVLEAEGGAIQAKSGMLPKISGSYQYSWAKDDREDQPGTLNTRKTYYNFGLTQPVFHWNTLKNNARIGELRQHIAEQQYAEAYRKLVQEIRSTYMQLILKKIDVANSRNDRLLADTALKLAQEKYGQKVVTGAEVFQVEIANERAHLATEYAEMDLLQVKQTFAALTGLPQPSDETIPSEIDGLASSQGGVDRMLADFLGHTEPATAPALIMRQQIEAEDLTYQNQKKRLLPKFNFVAGINQDEQSYTANVGLKYGLQSRYVGLQATWTIFDGFESRGAIASSLARKRQLEARYQQMKETLGQDAQRAAKQVELAYRQMQINDRLQDSAASYLKHRQGEFQRGLASEKDVADADANYKNMFSRTTASRYAYLMRVVEFVSLVGADPATANLPRTKA